MSQPLPPDLSRLGDEIVRATARRTRELRRRAERRGRIARTGAATVVVVALLALQGGERPAATAPVAATTAATVYRPVACDQPRGATFAAVRPCASPGSTDVEPQLMARRYAVQ